ncbi:hypothetical protein AMATHDRAFT_141329 [Amanita thiersii Skay4041]|uniref:Uncharacterized protein n=1 Tax=Amanita thiersii Skay4041 TaxID=703135 RepID=A0A2A9NN19_9AGAR|nr:hypothetical protein AMATHDRAFT_141329 [Amanita thiersii Skay4041]
MLSFPVHDNWRLAVTAVNRARRERCSMANLILPRLYLAGYTIASDSAELVRLGVTHVVSVLEHAPSLPKSIKEECRLHVKVADRAEANLLEKLDTTTSFIRAALNENDTNVVLVHCLMGISRSATVLCAYLIATKNMKVDQAINYVQSKRPIISPNTGFKEQLETYAKRHKQGTHSTQDSRRHDSGYSLLAKFREGIGFQIG